MDTPPAGAKKPNLLMRILVVTVALISIAGGISRCNKGVAEIRGTRNGVVFDQLLKEADIAVEAGNKYGLEAIPIFQKLLNDVDSLGLAKVRQEQKEVAQKTAGMFGKSAEQFRLAAQKTGEALQQEKREKYKPFLTAKIQAYESYAEFRSLNQDIARMALDESITKVGDLVKKAEEVGKRRDAALKAGQEAEARANAIAEGLKDKSK